MTYKKTNPISKWFQRHTVYNKCVWIIQIKKIDEILPYNDGGLSVLHCWSVLQPTRTSYTNSIFKILINRLYVSNRRNRYTNALIFRTIEIKHIYKVKTMYDWCNRAINCQVHQIALTTILYTYSFLIEYLLTAMFRSINVLSWRDEKEKLKQKF